MLTDFIKGLNLIKEKFLKDGKEGDVCAEHDMITVWGIDFSKMTEFHVRELVALGFLPGMDGDDNPDEILDDAEVEYSHEGWGFQWENVNSEQWNALRPCLSECFTYYC